MITELLMQHGSFTVPLKPDTPHSIWESIGGIENVGLPSDVGTPGVIFITPQELDPMDIGGDAVIAAARYAGPILKKRSSRSGYTLSGVGQLWWLQSPRGLGDIYVAEVTLSGSTIDNALTQLLPAAIVKGTISETGWTATSSHQFEGPLDAVRTIMAETHCEFRINPNATIDAGYFSTLFNVTAPTVVASREASGSDPLYFGVPIIGAEAIRDYSDMATEGFVYKTNVNGSKTLVATSSRASVQLDMHGNAIVREFAEEQPSGAAVAVSDYVDSRLASHVATSTFRLETPYAEIEGGMPIGDAWYVFDPPAFVDLTNPVQFRGDIIYPIVLRAVEANWPIRTGMGVCFRPSTGTGVGGAVTDEDWIVLTRFLAPEDGSSTQIILRGVEDYSAVSCA